MFLRFLILIFLAPSMCFAQDLEKLRADLEKSQQIQEKLENKVDSTNDKIANLQERSILLTEKLQTTENRILLMESKIAQTQRELSILQSEIDMQRKDIAKSSVVIIKIARIPLWAIILRKDTRPIDTARSQMLARVILKEAKQKTNALVANLAELEKLTARTDMQKMQAQSDLEIIKMQMNALDAITTKRKLLLISLKSDYAKQRARSQEIAKQVNSIEGLIGKLNKEPQAKQTFGKQELTAKLPVSGIIRTRWGEKDTLGATSQGLTIDALSGAVVVAPMDGVVSFAGEFQNYGNIIIIKHDDDYYSLLAGLEKITTLLNQRVVMGEPIGNLATTGDAHKQNRATLYYELRVHGKPVDPAQRLDKTI